MFYQRLTRSQYLKFLKDPRSLKSTEHCKTEKNCRVDRTLLKLISIRAVIEAMTEGSGAVPCQNTFHWWST